MVDRRGRVTLYPKKSHQKMLAEICKATRSDESEVFLDALKFYYRDLLRTGEITTDNDAAIRVIRKIAAVMGNDEEGE